MFKLPTPCKGVNKLPKRFWIKGKSKFVEIRLHEEKCADINQLYLKYDRIEKWHRSWLYKLFAWIKSLFINPDLNRDKRNICL